MYGYITDEESEPVVEAAIFVNSQFKGTSNAAGYYKVDVPVGQEVSIRVDAYSKSQFDSFRLRKAGDQRRKDYIFKVTNVRLGTAEVTGQVRNKPILEIDPKDQVKFPGMQVEQALLRTAIGVASRNELSSSYNVRGGNFDENLIYVNDIEVYRPFLARSGQQEGLSFVNPHMTNKVSFSAGGFDAKYGDKLSSVLDVKYNQPRKFAGTASLSMLGASLHVEDQPGRTGRFTYVLGARYRTLQYVLNTLDVAGDYKPRFTDIQALFSYRLHSMWKVEYFTTYAQNSYLVIPESRSTSFGTLQSAVRLFVAFDGQELTEYQTWLNAATLEFRPSPKSRIKFITSNFNSRELEYYTVEGAYRLEELENNLGSDNFAQAKSLLGIGYFINNARNRLEYNVSSQKLVGTHEKGRHLIDWGTKYQTEIIHDKLREWQYNDSAGYNHTSQPHAPDEIVLDEFLASRNNLSSYRMTGFVQDRIMLNKAIDMRLTVGVRSHYWSLNGQNVISPRGTFSIEPNKKYNDTIRNAHYLLFDNKYLTKKERDELMARFPDLDSVLYNNLKRSWVFRFSSGVYYQPPFYRELRNSSGVVNMDLRAQRSIHFVAGADLLFKAWTRDFRFVGEVYYKMLDNLIPYTINNVRLRYDAVNSSYGYAGGFDARINGEFIKGLESWLNFSFLTTKENITFEDDNGEKQTGFIRRPTDQRINFSILFQDELPTDSTFKMHLNLVIGSSLPYYFNGPYRYEERFKLPAYRRVDIGFSKELLTRSKLERNSLTRPFNSLWMSLEVFNMLQVNNTASYIWVEDLNNNLYGVPNYLTGRRLNLKLIAEF